MTERLYVATRKGLLEYVKADGDWVCDRQSFVGDPVTAVLRDDRDGSLYAALNLGHFGVKMHRSDDAGVTWRELPAPAFPAVPDATDGPSVSLIWTLAAGGADQPGWLWAGTLPGGLFLSRDNGESWALNEALWQDPRRSEWNGGGYDHPGIHSICVDPRDSRRLVIGVSTGGVWMTGDAGQTWSLGGKGLRAAYMPPALAFEPIAQDPHRLVRCPVAPDVIWCQHHNGIFRSLDGGENFTEIETASPSAFGFAVAVHPADPDTAWFVPAVKDEFRYPVDQRLVVTVTRDGGKRFTTLDTGLPDQPSFDLIYRHALDVDDAGARLAMGSTTGNLWIGEAGGTRWQQVSGYLPPIHQVLWV